LSKSHLPDATLTKEIKQEHDFAGLIWFIRKQNQYPAVPGTLTRRIPQLPTEFFNELWCGGRLGKYKITPPKLAIDTQPFSRM